MNSKPGPVLKVTIFKIVFHSTERQSKNVLQNLKGIISCLHIAFSFYVVVSISRWGHFAEQTEGNILLPAQYTAEISLIQDLETESKWSFFP